MMHTPLPTTFSKVAEQPCKLSWHRLCCLMAAGGTRGGGARPPAAGGAGCRWVRFVARGWVGMPPLQQQQKRCCAAVAPRFAGLAEQQGQQGRWLSSAALPALVLPTCVRRLTRQPRLALQLRSPAP